MKIPQYMTKICRDMSTVKDCAKALEIEAAHYRRGGNRLAAEALRKAAQRLKLMAKEKTTWAVAFDWDSDDPMGRK
jgi:poly(3-hydroxyalkanoate) synthetase